VNLCNPLSPLFHVRRLALALMATFVVALGVEPAHATTIERVVSPGGIEAWLVRDSSVPMIAVEIGFLGGSNQDPEAKPGVASLVAALLDEGAGKLDSSAFQRRLEELSVGLSFRTQRDYFYGTLRMLRDRRAEGFELLRLALNEPRFDTEPIERIRAQVMARLQRETTSPTDIASKLWWSTAFPDHAYGRQSGGTQESIPLINADDLKDYARRVIARDTLKVAVVGDIDAATLAQELDRAFGTLPAKAELKPVPPARMAAVGRRVVVDLDVPQTVLAFGGLSIPRDDPDYIPAYVVNHVLGGGTFSSRLYREVREKHGLAYSVYSYLLPLDHTSLLMGATATRADRAAETLAIIEAEIHRIAQQGPTADELEKAKSFLKGSYALRFDTSAKIAGQLLAIQIDDLGIDYIQRRNSLIDAVTMADAQRAAKRLCGGGLLVTVVGRPHGLASTEQGGSALVPSGEPAASAKPAR
jgi:zinc protease